MWVYLLLIQMEEKFSLQRKRENLYPKTHMVLFSVPANIIFLEYLTFIVWLMKLIKKLILKENLLIIYQNTILI